MRVLIVTAVDRERRAVPMRAGVDTVVAGLGRTNAACATTERLMTLGSVDAVINAGVAGALPGGGLALREPVVATGCVYVEEGMITPAGFVDTAAMGFPLGDFPGNCVPVDPDLQRRLATRFTAGPIATVATCSGTDEAARMVTERTGAIAEAMEGAAVVHAAARRGVPAIELRVISNTTGDRDQQLWDLEGAIDALGRALDEALGILADRP